MAEVAETPKNTFRMTIDQSSMLPNNRLGEAARQEDYIEFAELPREFSLSKSANYQEDQVLGRSEPYVTYANSGPTRMTFSARLVATGTPAERGLAMDIAGGALGLTGRFVNNLAPWAGAAVAVAGKLGNAVSALFGDSDLDQEKINITFAEVTQKMAWLEALLHPQYDDSGISYPPPMLYLMYGQNLLRHGIVKDVTFSMGGPWEMQTLLCMVVDCNIQFQEVNKAPKGYLDARNIKQPVAQDVAAGGINARSVIDNVRSISGL
jgi:hypothetical protein